MRPSGLHRRRKAFLGAGETPFGGGHRDVCHSGPPSFVKSMAVCISAEAMSSRFDFVVLCCMTPQTAAAIRAWGMGGWRD